MEMVGEKRVLLCGADSALEAHLRTALAQSEHQLVRCDATRGGFTLPDGGLPEVVLLSEARLDSGGSTLLSRLREAQVAVIALTSDTSVAAVVRWLRLGATDVRAPMTISAQMIAEVQGPWRPVVERFLAWAHREVLTGELRVLPDTPLEGLAFFQDGLLQRAAFCGLHAEAALREMLEMEDVEPTFSSATLATAASLRPYAPKVLVVEDDSDLRHLLARLVERQGYRVFEAEDGLQALEVAQRERLDAVVTDLDLPRLDGWGLLQALRHENATREVPVLLLSAHEDAVNTLRAARAGARAYLKKTGRSRELIDALSLLTAPRQRVWTALRSRLQVAVEAPALGAAWLLETLAELDVCGRLELEDELGRYEVNVAQGRLLSAVAQTGSLRVMGLAALEAVLTSRGRGRVVFCEQVMIADAPWLFDALAQVRRVLILAAAQQVSESVRSPRRLRIDDELATLYARGASVRELRVLDGLRQRPATLEELSSQVAVPLSDVSRMVGELLRRGILSDSVER